MKNADTAMYRAKQMGGNAYQFYRTDMNELALQRLEKETALRRALERQEFILHYQPQFDLSSGTVVGFEGLIRWQRPDIGLVLPLEFIPLLEETGVILPVSEWVLHTACVQHQAWCRAMPMSLRIAVNISGRHFDAEFVEMVKRVYQASCMDPLALELEITESVLMKDTQQVIEVLNQMDAVGVRFAVDNFGTGYSSLSYLKRFPIDVLKIDPSFIQDVTHNEDDAAIVCAIITMARSLGIKSLADGVETREQLEFLQAQGCDLAQGNFFSIPLPAEEVTALLQSKHVFYDPQVVPLGKAKTLKRGP